MDLKTGTEVFWERFGIKRTPAQLRNSQRRSKAWSIEFALPHYFPWMHWPILHIMYAFWGSILEEGVYSTIKPRWGMMTFAYLNDGMGTNAWFVLYLITHRPYNDLNALYPNGAPKSLEEAKKRTLYPEV